MRKSVHLSYQTPANRRRRRLRLLCEGAVIAALYVAMTWLSNAVGLASGVIQVRVSEALCVLTLFTPAAVPGLTIGCLLSNLTMGSVLWDILFGSLATLLGTLGGYGLGCFSRYAVRHGWQKRGWICKMLLPLPTVLANTVIVPMVLIYAYAMEGSFVFFALTVGMGEMVSAWFLGILLLLPLERKTNIFV